MQKETLGTLNDIFAEKISTSCVFYFDDQVMEIACARICWNVLALRHMERRGRKDQVQ